MPLPWSILSWWACAPEPEPRATAPVGETSGGQSGEDPAYPCADRELPPTAELTGDQGSFDANSVRAMASGERWSTFVWVAGAPTTVHLELGWDGDATVVESRPRAGSSEADCPDWIGLEGTVAFRTDDGAFDERSPARLVSTDGQQGRFGLLFWPDTLVGDYALASDAVVDAWVLVDADGGSGRLDEVDGDGLARWIASFSPR